MRPRARVLNSRGRWLINENWDAALTYAYTNAELTDTAPGLVGPFDVLDGTRLPGSPEHQATFNVTYNTTIWDSVDLAINYGVVYTGGIYNIPGGDKDPLVDPDTGAPGDRGGEEIPSYDVHHLSATFSKDAWLVQAYVDNLTDEYYILGTRTSKRFLQDEQTGPGNSYQWVHAPKLWPVRRRAQEYGCQAELPVLIRHRVSPEAIGDTHSIVWVNA